MLVGQARAISWTTVSVGLWKEMPKSPWSALFVQRPVEPVLVEDVLFGGRWERCLLLVERPAWNRVHEHECQHRDDREDDEDAGEAAEEVDNHRKLSAGSYQPSAISC